MRDTSTTPVLDLMASTIGGSMALRTSPREIAEAVLLALAGAGYKLSSNLCTLCGRGTEQPSICLVCQELARS